MPAHHVSSCRRGALVAISSLALLGLALLGGCQKRTGAGEPAQAKSPDSDKPVATIGDTKITVGMLEEELNRQNPYLRMRFASPERRKEFLKNMVRFEVLAQEAKR